jgi:hypothetical protein
VPKNRDRNEMGLPGIRRRNWAMSTRRQPSKPFISAGTLSAAPGPYLGFALQPVRFCYYLLTSAGADSVSLEHLDDVALHTSHGVTLEQTKSALTQNPVSNWSTELWKTFANWIEMIELGQIDVASTSFRLYVTPKRTGKFVRLLNDAVTDLAADKAIAYIEKEAKKLEPPPAAYESIKKLLNLDHLKRRLLVRRFSFESSHDDPIEALRALISVTVADSMVDICCEYAIGHAKEAADALIRRRVPALLNSGEFRREFKAFVRKNDLSGILVELADAPPVTEVEKTLVEAPTFVQQLRIIDLPADLQVRAVSDFLQASANKTKWAENGHIVRESLVEFETDLLRKHRLIDLELEDTRPELESKMRGRKLYVCCVGSPLNLERREVPGFFVPGSYNDLANRLELGWHPDYKMLVNIKES